MLSHCYRFISRPPTKHFVQHINQLGILSHDSHVWNVLFLPYNKARRWTNEQNWNLELCLEFTPAGLYTAIHSTYESSWHVESFGFTCPVPYETLCLTYEPAWHRDLCQNCPCLPLQQNNTLNTWKKRHLEPFLKFTSPRPYKAIRSKKRRKLTCSHVESFLKLCPPRPYKANGWTSAENWHVGLFWNL